jgi:LemA protein
MLIYAALLLALIILGIWLVHTHNRLIGLMNQVANAWKQIDIQLARRHDLIPNLVEAVRGAMRFERDTLEAVVTARNQAVRVMQSGAGLTQTFAVEAELSLALGRLVTVIESHPELKSLANVARLQEELTSTENRIAFARQHYNDTAVRYNTRQQEFPTNLVAGFSKAKPAELWQLSEEAAAHEPPVIDLSLEQAKTA